MFLGNFRYIKIFYKNASSFILDKDVNERSISHRLANYIEPHFPGWNVECEYNLNHDDSKRLDIYPRNVQSDNTQATTVYPGIIIHRRGTDENLVVIEMKKTTTHLQVRNALGCKE